MSIEPACSMKSELSNRREKGRCGKDPLIARVANQETTGFKVGLSTLVKLGGSMLETIVRVWNGTE